MFDSTESLVINGISLVCEIDFLFNKLKIVDLPTLGNPIIPQVKDIVLNN